MICTVVQSGKWCFQSSLVLALIGMLFVLPRVRNMVASVTNMKDLWILRHGQATHNPRAEAARAGGCNFDEFFELMRQDDSLDAPLTEHGRQQALNIAKNHVICADSWGTNIELVVSSPLSRALETANLALPPSPSHDSRAAASQRVVNRVCYEGFREINGVLLNAQRRTASELRSLFPDWDFEHLSTEEDETWNAETLECTVAAALRGLRGLRWLQWERPETSILLVAHGGILRHLMEHPHCVLQDERMHPTNGNGLEEQLRPVSARFGNCELRRYRLGCSDDESKSIILTEVDVENDEIFATEETKAMLSSKQCR
jgi:broad specificity phosphatase PhoE